MGLAVGLALLGKEPQVELVCRHPFRDRLNNPGGFRSSQVIADRAVRDVTIPGNPPDG